jgi:hypothetical protein
MRRRWLALAMAATCAVAASTAAAEPQGVVELFTSQGCSSCPAADRLLGQLAADPAYVAISLPVDYWDYLGWKDTLADSRNGARQRGYAQARGDRQVYTPQAVVNGALHALGSDRGAIDEAVAKSRRSGAMSLLPVRLAVTGGQIKVAVPEAAGGSAEVWLCGLVKAVTVAIGRGENRGRSVTYHNVARRWVKLGEWTGKAGAWTLPLERLAGDGVEEAALLVQGGSKDKPAAILGAALASIR